MRHHEFALMRHHESTPVGVRGYASDAILHHLFQPLDRASAFLDQARR